MQITFIKYSFCAPIFVAFVLTIYLGESKCRCCCQKTFVTLLSINKSKIIAKAEGWDYVIINPMTEVKLERTIWHT